MLDVKEKTDDAVKGITDRGPDQTMQIAGDKTREAASAIMGAVKEKMHDVADGATALVGKTTDKAKEMASSVGDAAVQAKDKAKEMASSVGDAAVQAKDKAKEMASSVGDAAVYAKDQVKQAASATVEKAGDLGQDATDLIRRYPIAALVIGLGAGFLLGQVLHSSSRRA